MTRSHSYFLRSYLLIDSPVNLTDNIRVSVGQ